MPCSRSPVRLSSARRAIGRYRRAPASHPAPPAAPRRAAIPEGRRIPQRHEVFPGCWGRLRHSGPPSPYPVARANRVRQTHWVTLGGRAAQSHRDGGRHRVSPGHQVSGKGLDQGHRSLTSRSVLRAQLPRRNHPRPRPSPVHPLPPRHRSSAPSPVGVWTSTRSTPPATARPSCGTVVVGRTRPSSTPRPSSSSSTASSASTSNRAAPRGAPR